MIVLMYDFFLSLSSSIQRYYPYWWCVCVRQRGSKSVMMVNALYQWFNEESSKNRRRNCGFCFGFCANRSVKKHCEYLSSIHPIQYPPNSSRKYKQRKVYLPDKPQPSVWFHRQLLIAQHTSVRTLFLNTQLWLKESIACLFIAND